MSLVMYLSVFKQCCYSGGSLHMSLVDIATTSAFTLHHTITNIDDDSILNSGHLHT